jgi:tRNA-2-methylthio-N6-dimethylallyladenosine synthase
MGYERQEIPTEAVAEQLAVCERLRQRLTAGGRVPLALVDTYGCQQNEADSEQLRGYLEKMGFGFTKDEYAADLVLVNTCAVREHAEMRILGNVGSLNHTKEKNPRQLIAVCGCMVQQKHMAERLRRSFRLVDLVFGPHELWRFPALLEETLEGRGRVFSTEMSDGAVAEGLPVRREGKAKAWLSVMYGCNNFCSYCVVPYVRGRERSREPGYILEEARALVEDGCRDITLLGQNVNSYGRDLGNGTDFADLLRLLNGLPGDFRLRFMTSHPKDATEKLFRTMAECEKCAGHLHLPVQSGSDRILKAMNRGYDGAAYREKAAMARRAMPELVLTTDIIVGFPGETEEDFEDTLRLVEDVRFDSMFTFLYSRREGTLAAEMPDTASREEKLRRFDRLLALSNTIAAQKQAAYVGKTLRVLIDGTSEGKDNNLTARTDGGRLVHLRGSPELVGSFADVRIKASNTWSLFGEIAEAGK